MKKIHKFFIFFAIFLIIFLFLSWENFYKNFNILTNFDKNIPEIQYNIALQMAKEKNFDEAMKILPKNMEISAERLFELEWDLKWMKNFETGAILESYKKSLAISENSRVSEKIAMLESTEKNQKNTENEQEKISENIQKASEDIEQDQKKRSEYLDPYATSLENYRQDVKKIKNLLEKDGASAEKDW